MATTTARGVDDGKVGVPGWCLGGKLAYLPACRTDCDVALGYCGVGIGAALDEADRIRSALALHIAEREHFDKASALLVQQCTIATLKRAIGPNVDLAALWDKHCEYELAARDIDATMATMVAEPYVNARPTRRDGNRRWA
jgi:carboxymethylenebutenolidase